MKAPLKRAVTIYFSGERFSTQHPESLQCCILDARGGGVWGGGNLTFMTIALNLGIGGS